MRRGFTLLEVLVAMAVLGLALVALADLNIGAVRMHSYSKQVSIATLLARGKMLDVEQELMADGVPVDDDADDGDFSDEGFPSYQWETQIIRPRTEDLSTDQVFALLAGGMDDGKPGGFLSSLFGSGDKKAGAGAAGGALVAGAMQMQAQQFLDSIGKTLREIRLTVSWPDGQRIEKFAVVTHIVVTGAGSDVTSRELAASAPPGLTAPPGTPMLSPASGGVLPPKFRGFDPAAQLPLRSGRFGPGVPAPDIDPTPR